MQFSHCAKHDLVPFFKQWSIAKWLVHRENQVTRKQMVLLTVKQRYAASKNHVWKAYCGRASKA
jgi:hypothetical protein